MVLEITLIIGFALVCYYLFEIRRKLFFITMNQKRISELMIVINQNPLNKLTLKEQIYYKNFDH